jgi:hypothetical protein
MRPESNRLASVAVFARPYLRHVVVDLARVLKARFGSAVHLYFATEQERSFYETTASNFASMNRTNQLLDPVETPSDERLPDLFARARAMEAFMGTTLNRLNMTSRHFGRAFALGGINHPRTRLTDAVDYENLVTRYVRLLEYIDAELTSKQVTLVVNGTLPWMIWTRAKGIPFRTLIEARFKDHYKWAVDEFLDTPIIKDAYAAIADDDPVLETPIELDTPAVTQQYRTITNRQKSVAALTRSVTREVIRNVYWRLRGYDKAKTSYTLASNLAYHWRRWLVLRQQTSARMPGLEVFGAGNFVFFPLHTEPEHALQALSPEYFFQLECIASIARDLPAGYRLLVKEHTFAAGRRPGGFYDHIRDFKNVIMVNADIPGVEIARRCAAVVTITSTVGLEAALMGKPVISFGRHNVYNLLPHVRKVERPEDIPPALQEALFRPQDRNAMLRAGRRLLAAIVRTSFPMGPLSQWKPDAYNAEQFEVAFSALLASLELPDAAGTPSPRIFAS